MGDEPTHYYCSLSANLLKIRSQLSIDFYLHVGKYKQERTTFNILADTLSKCQILYMSGIMKAKIYPKIA